MAAEVKDDLATNLKAVAEGLEKLAKVVAGELELDADELWDLGVEDKDDPLFSWLRTSVYDIERREQYCRLLLAGGGPTIWLVIDSDGWMRLEGHWGSESAERELGLVRLGREVRGALAEVGGCKSREE